MHNSISSNQLAEWKHFEDKDASNKKLDKENDYYNCMIEAEENKSDKRICSEILKE